jgi:hypothetical protein
MPLTCQIVSCVLPPSSLLLHLQNMLRLCIAVDFNDLLNLCVKLLEDQRC